MSESVKGGAVPADTTTPPGLTTTRPMESGNGYP